jgi:hypothetical protein
MGRAKHQAGKPPAESAPVALEVSSEAPAVAVAPEFAPGIDGALRPKGLTLQPGQVIETRAMPDEIRRGNIEFGHRPIEAGYVHPEERGNPEYLRDLEARNLAAARPSWGLDQQAKIVNPSPNMGQQRAQVLW